MATITIKFRPSSIKEKEGCLYYQVTHNRTMRQLKTNFYIYQNEWNPITHEIKISMFTQSKERRIYLSEVKRAIVKNMKKWKMAINILELKKIPYTSDEVIAMFKLIIPENSFFDFMENQIIIYKNLGKIRTSETYSAAMKSFNKYLNNTDIAIDEINRDIIMGYEAFLKGRNISANTSSFYMRNLRAMYNQAVEKGLSTQNYPFKNVYTGIDRTIKRAISLEVIKLIKELDFKNHPKYEFARDMFMFSFYTRGMSFIDMAYLRTKDLKNGLLTYRRHKTGQQLNIKWEQCMEDIVMRYRNHCKGYLLPIIITSSRINEREQYIYKAHNINRYLKNIGKNINIPVPLTMYVARHTWASIANSQNIPLSIISQGMGHNSEITTQIYLASMDTSVIDKANKMILTLI